MKYSETGFRSLYKRFAVFELNESLMNCLEGFPRKDEANCVIVYGYIDHEAGMTLELLCAGKQNGKELEMFDGDDERRAVARIEGVKDLEFTVLGDDEWLTQKHSKKIEMLSGYSVNEEIETSRSFTFLDGCRHEFFPDDIMVVILKDDFEPEGCWVNIFGLGERCFIGRVLSEPNQDFGCHIGDEIKFYAQKQDDDSVMCFSDGTPLNRCSAEDLEDGQMLRDAVAKFKEEQNEINLYRLLNLLRDSYVWVPCTAVMDEQDEAKLQKMFEDAGGDTDKIIGETFTTSESVRLIPDILQNGDEFFFPIFSSAEEMGEYGEHFSKVQKHMLEAMALAQNNEKNISGMVLDAFSGQFVINTDLIKLIWEMQSKVEHGD